MSTDRQRLRPWLIARIESGEVPGLRWINKEKTQFRVTWKHAGKPDFELERDAVLFRMWAEHTGKYKPGEQPDPSTWKTRFRCALHKMPDIEEIRVPHSLDDREPYRVFQLKPKVPSSPKSKLSRTTASSRAVSTPSPSPTNDYDNGFLYPPGAFLGHNGYFQSNYIPMSYNVPDPSGFPSPLSSHTSSPPHLSDINGNASSLYIGADDELDSIIPTIPPMFGSNGHMDNGMEHSLNMKSQSMPNGLSEDYFMKSNFTNNFTNSIPTICYPISSGENQCEPTLTELQSVRNESMISYIGGGNGAIMYEGTPFTGSIGNSGQSSYLTAHSGSNIQMTGLQKWLHAGFPLETVQEISQMPQVSNNASIGNNPMDSSMSNNYSTMKISELPSVSSLSTINGVTFFELEKLTAPKRFKDKAGHILSARVLYEDKEVMDFYFGKDERIIRMFHGKQMQVKQEENTGLCYFNQCSTKQIQLPDFHCSPEVKCELANFNRGLAIEISNNGNIWAMKLCLSEVFFYCGTGHATKLLPEVKTKVLDFSDELQRKCQQSKSINCAPPSVTFTLGQQPSKPSVSVIITHVQAKERIMGKNSSTLQMISEQLADQSKES